MRSRTRYQSGQALVLGLALTSLGILAWVTSYYLSHLVHDKLSLLRATDAAALSTATSHARTLNFHAYLNRAQLAHQLAMLHLVTLASQERFRATQAQQASQMNPPAYLIGIFFGPSYAASYLAAKAGGISDGLAIAELKRAFNHHDQMIQDVLEQTRLALIGDFTQVRNKLVERVLINNVGASGSRLKGNHLVELGVSYEIKQDAIARKIHYFSTKSPIWMDTFKNVQEPYAYLKPRNEIRKNIWAINARCPHKRHQLRRRGQTTVDKNGWYESNDTLSFHAIRSNRAIGCYQREYPMGWALIQSDEASQLLESPRQDFSSMSFWRWVKNQNIPGWDIFNGSENFLGTSWARGQKIQWQSKSRPGFTDVKHAETDFRFAIEVLQKNPFQLDSNHLNPRNGRFGFQSFGLDAKDLIHANSAASTYFERPEPRKNGKGESPNLFHPYWHARLVKP